MALTRAVLLCVLIVSTVHAFNVAVIGGGIGGAATAYYTTKFMQETGVEVRVDVFEKTNILGGRLASVEVGGTRQNVGGDAWSEVNYYTVELAQDLDLPLDLDDDYDGNGQLGVWGKGGFQAYRRLLLMHPEMDANVLRLTRNFSAALEINYRERGVRRAFTTINEFLQYGEMTSFVDASTHSVLSSLDISDQYQETLIEPITRVIYGQELDLHAFAGVVSLLPTTTSTYSAKNGNDNLVKTVMSASNATVYLSSAILSAQQTSDGKFMLKTANSSTQASIGETKYDAVVLACPFEYADVSFPFPIATVRPRNWVTWVVTQVIADGLDPSYFDEGASFEVPDSILTMNSSTLPFNVISIESQAGNGQNIYKIFSKTSVESDLDSIFLNMTSYSVKSWEYTFPVLSPTRDFQPIVLAPSLFYVNTMESVASAIEGSVIAGRNIALLIARDA